MKNQNNHFKGVSQLVTICLLGATVSACGMKRLSDDEKREFWTTAASAGKGFEAANKAKPMANAKRGAQLDEATAGFNPTLNPTLNSLMALPLFNAGALTSMVEKARNHPSDSSAETSTTPSDIDYMSQELKPEVCDFTETNTLPKSSAGMPQVDPFNGSGTYTFSAKGKDCPIALDVNMGFYSSMQNASSMNLGLKVGVDYSVLKDDYKKLNDVYGLKLNMDLGGQVNGQSKEATLKLTGDGLIKSQAKGDISLKGDGDFTVNGEAKNMNADLKVEFKFPSFTAVVEETISADEHGQTQKLLLNGEEVTQAEIEKLFKP